MIEWRGVLGALFRLGVENRSNAGPSDLIWARGGCVPRFGTVEFSVPRLGIVRPFSFSCGKFEAACGGSELRAIHTSKMIDEWGLESIRSCSSRQGSNVPYNLTPKSPSPTVSSE